MEKKKTKAKKAKKKAIANKFPKRIRMLRSCANQHMAYLKGYSYEVPQQVSVETAGSWFRSGTAEEDKSLAGVPKETK